MSPFYFSTLHSRGPKLEAETRHDNIETKIDSEKDTNVGPEVMYRSTNQILHEITFIIPSNLSD